MEQATITPKKINWIKLTGLAFLLHIALILISIIEVFFYSLLISPGKDEAFYEDHANDSGPWVSGIFGSLLIFFLVRRFIKKNNNGQHLTYTIALPLIYILLDVIILLFFNIDWNEHFPILLMANGVKIAAAFLSYYIYKPRLA